MIKTTKTDCKNFTLKQKKKKKKKKKKKLENKLLMIENIYKI